MLSVPARQRALRLNRASVGLPAQMSRGCPLATRPQAARRVPAPLGDSAGLARARAAVWLRAGCTTRGAWWDVFPSYRWSSL